MRQMKRLVILMAASLLIPFFCVQAQKGIQYSQYMEMKEAMNPASVAVDDMMSVGGVYRIQWAGFKDAPKDFLLTLSYPLRIGETRHGIGLIFSVDDIGLVKNQSVLLQYSYRFKLLRGEISLGLNVGFINQKFDKEGADLTGGKGELMSGDEYHNVSDPFIEAMTAEEYTDNAFDVSFGCMYRRERWYVGVSVLHLTASKIDMGSERYQMYVPRCLHLDGAYTFETHRQGWTITPSGQIFTDFSTWQGEVTGIFEYNKRVRAGLSYRFGDAFVFHWGLVIIPGLRLGYTYDLPTSKMIKSGGSHEITLRYSFKPQFTRKNKYKSERIL